MKIEDLLVEQLEKPPDIEEIKSAIPLILSLHPSWNRLEHIGWQILRLNPGYRQSFINLYRNRLIPSYTSLLHSPIFAEFPPLPQESFQDYERRVTEGTGENIAHQSGLYRGLRLVLKPGNKRILSREFPDGYAWEDFRIDLDRNDLIPHTLRFPNPLIRPLLPFDRLQRLMIRKGRTPENWSKNLLVYELSQARMKNIEIARLLFGATSSTEWLPYDGKHPDLVRIAKIKKRIEKDVSNVYPLD